MVSFFIICLMLSDMFVSVLLRIILRIGIVYCGVNYGWMWIMMNSLIVVMN